MPVMRMRSRQRTKYQAANIYNFIQIRIKFIPFVIRINQIFASEIGRQATNRCSAIALIVFNLFSTHEMNENKTFEFHFMRYSLHAVQLDSKQLFNFKDLIFFRTLLVTHTNKSLNA